ncbi:MAG: hypothetical protein ACOYOO_16000, partial [Saprospiraceae bacterium]
EKHVGFKLKFGAKRYEKTLYTTPKHHSERSNVKKPFYTTPSNDYFGAERTKRPLYNPYPC